MLRLFNEKLHITWKHCENCKKESDKVFYFLASNGVKLCEDCVEKKYA